MLTPVIIWEMGDVKITMLATSDLSSIEGNAEAIEKRLDVRCPWSSS